jgi:hypothetical protein
VTTAQADGTYDALLAKSVDVEVVADSKTRRVENAPTVAEATPKAA